MAADCFVIISDNDTLRVEHAGLFARTYSEAIPVRRTAFYEGALQELHCRNTFSRENIWYWPLELLTKPNMCQ